VERKCCEKDGGKQAEKERKNTWLSFPVYMNIFSSVKRCIFANIERDFK